MIKNILHQSLESLIYLEYLGIHIEDVKNEINFVKYYFSVPELSTLEINDKKLTEKIKNYNGLIQLTKDVLTEMIISSFENIKDEEFIESVKNNINEYCSFYARVRKGDIWNKNKAEDVIKTLKCTLKK